MDTIVAAVDGGESSRRVLETATALGGLFELEVEAVHVGRHRAPALHELTEEVGVGLHIIEGDPIEVLARTLARTDVPLGVLGSEHGPGHPRPVGAVARQLVATTATPVVVVPPQAPAPRSGSVRRALAPLDGTTAASRAVAALLADLVRHGVEVVALHVFDEEHLPPLLDQPHHGLPAWRKEFVARHARPEAHLELRLGEVWSHVVDLATREHADLVVLGWSQQFAEGRARVVTRLLTRCPVPVLLAPVDDRAS